MCLNYCYKKKVLFKKGTIFELCVRFYNMPEIILAKLLKTNYNLYSTLIWFVKHCLETSDPQQVGKKNTKKDIESYLNQFVYVTVLFVSKKIPYTIHGGLIHFHSIEYQN